MDEQQPGQTITPTPKKSQVESPTQASEAKSQAAEINDSLKSDASPQAAPNSAAEQPPDQLAEPATAPEQPSPADAQPATAAVTPWQFSAEGNSQPAEPANSKSNDTPLPLSNTAPSAPVSWSASEYIHHQKSFGWYALLILGGAVVAAVVFLVTHDKISTSVVVVATLALAAFANHPPRVLDYRLDATGLSVGQKFYDYGQFKSFSIAPEGAFVSVVLTPLKRFVPPLSIYFAPEDEDKVVDMLADRLPMEEHKADAIDRFASRIRF